MRQGVFRKLKGNGRPPFKLHGWEKRFIADFMTHIPGAAPEAASILKEALSLVRQEFRQEYEGALTSYLECEHSNCIVVDNPPT